MSAAARLAGFVAVVALVLLGGLGLGRAVGPVESAGTDDAVADEGHGSDDAAQDDPDGGHDEPAPGEAITGLAVSEDGLTLRPAATTLAVGAQDFRFTVEADGGEPLTDYDLTHEKELHLVLVRRDGTGFQHLHPEQGADGTWSTPLVLDRPGAYRAYADFAPAGRPARTLATDLVVPGAYEPQPWPAPSDAVAVDGLEVRLDGHLDAGEEAALGFEVTRDGAPVALEPYLGALGHLVVLRENDLGYLHVHADGDELSFATTAPSAGRYRLYLQFQVEGVVRTAELTATAEEAHA